MVIRLVRLLEARGQDPASACAASGLSLEELSDPSARIPYSRADALLEACAERIGVAGMSLALLPIRDDHTYDAAGLVLLSSPDLATGLTRAFAFQRLWGDGKRFWFDLTNGRDHGIVGFRHPGPSALARAVLAELALLETLVAARTLVDAGAAPVAVRFEHPPFADGGALAAVFGVEAEFGAEANEIHLSRALLESTIRTPEGVVDRVFQGLARQALAALPSSASLEERVRALCIRAPGGLTLSVAEVARRLHMSPRTLQRRLQSSGTSWTAIVDDARSSRARELSARGASLKEISFLLGFSEPSALARARARWDKPFR